MRATYKLVLGGYIEIIYTTNRIDIEEVNMDIKSKSKTRRRYFRHFVTHSTDSSESVVGNKNVFTNYHHVQVSASIYEITQLKVKVTYYISTYNIDT